MSTITKEFTKEHLIARINQVTAINKYRISRDPDADGLAMDNELLAIALASLEADAVAYVDPFAFHNFSVYRAGETDNKRMGREWMWANPDAGLIPVYTAPPAPVSVPTFDEWLEIRGNKPLGWVKDAMRESYDACRAAMLQGAENAGSTTTMHTAPALDSSLKIAESTSGKSPVIPDGWVACSERMPESDDFVYIWPRPDFGVELHVAQYGKFDKRDAGWYAQVYEQNYGIEYYPVKVTHWMPLPAAPQQEVKS